MEIKPDCIAFNLVEARWVVDQFGLPEELRRRVQERRRAVLAARLPSGFLDDVAELASDAAGNPASKLRWIIAETAMRAAEAELDAQAGGRPSHLIEVTADASDLTALHEQASSAHAAARAVAMDLSSHLQDIEATPGLHEFGPLSPADQALFTETTFTDALERQQVTAGIIAAIKDSL